MVAALPQNLITLNSMLFLEPTIIVVPHTEGVFHSWFINTYTSACICLLISLYVKNSSVD